MKLTTVQNLFWRRYPEGSLVRVARSKVRIRLSRDAKSKVVYSRSNYELAEGLGLIPHDSVMDVAMRVLFKLESVNEVFDQTGAGEIVRSKWEAGGTVTEEIFSVDHYGRPVSRYCVEVVIGSQSETGV